jgi:hypothetical protein
MLFEDRGEFGAWEFVLLAGGEVLDSRIPEWSSSIDRGDEEGQSQTGRCTVQKVGMQKMLQ